MEEPDLDSSGSRLTVRFLPLPTAGAIVVILTLIMLFVDYCRHMVLNLPRRALYGDVDAGKDTQKRYVCRHKTHKCDTFEESINEQNNKKFRAKGIKMRKGVFGSRGQRGHDQMQDTELRRRNLVSKLRGSPKSPRPSLPRQNSSFSPRDSITPATTPLGSYWNLEHLPVANPVERRFSQPPSSLEIPKPDWAMRKARLSANTQYFSLQTDMSPVSPLSNQTAPFARSVLQRRQEMLVTVASSEHISPLSSPRSSSSSKCSIEDGVSIPLIKLNKGDEG